MPLSPDDNPKVPEARDSQVPGSEDEELSQAALGDNLYWLILKDDEQPGTGMPVAMSGGLNRTEWLAKLNMPANQWMWYKKGGTVCLVTEEDQYNRMVKYALEM